MKLRGKILDPFVSGILGYFKLLFLASGRFLVFCVVGALVLALCAAVMFGAAKIMGSTGTFKTYDKDGNLIKEGSF